jgi:hypothetical protein
MWSTVARFVEVCRERGIEPIRAQFELDSSPLGWAIYHGEGQGSFVTTDGDLLYTVSGSGKFHVRPYSDPWPSPQMLEEAMTRYLLQQEA